MFECWPSETPSAISRMSSSRRLSRCFADRVANRTDFMARLALPSAELTAYTSPNAPWATNRSTTN